MYQLRGYLTRSRWVSFSSSINVNRTLSTHSFHPNTVGGECYRKCMVLWMFIRWIESERTEALLGKGDEERSIRHVDNAFLGFGSGPRVCPGQV